MARVLIVHGAQQRRIAERLAEVLRSDRDDVRLEPASPFPSVAGADAVLVVAEPRGGRHATALARAMRAHATVLKYLPSAFLSVCLAVAGDDPERKAEAERMLHAFLERTGWHPELAATVAGQLEPVPPGPFRAYRARARARRHGLTADVAAGCDFTDWDDVRRFAEAFSALTAEAGPQRYGRAPALPQRT